MASLELSSRCSCSVSTERLRLYSCRRTLNRSYASQGSLFHCQPHSSRPHRLQSQSQRHCALEAVSSPAPLCQSAKLQRFHARKCSRGQLLTTKAAATEEELYNNYDLLTDEIQRLSTEVVQGLGGTSLYLVGMMGSGKSLVAKLLSSALKYCCMDCDALIEAAAGCSISEIFEEQGEEEFRDLETKVLAELAPFTKCVVATGGGAVLRRKNWGYMQQAVIIWLDGAPKLLASRVVKDGTQQRPLAVAADQAGGDEYTRTVKRLQQLLEDRRGFYEVADVRVPLAGQKGDREENGAPAAIVTYRVLNAVNEKLKSSAEEREARKKFSVVDARDQPASSINTNKSPEVSDHLPHHS